MSEPTRRRERTITVETSELGPVRVRRLSLGGMARIAERLRAEGQHDEIALGDALVTEVIVAGLEDDPLPGDQAPDAFDNARLALLSQEDRRSIAAAVLTLEGVKATGDGVLEDPRSVLARRYSHVLETGQQPGQPDGQSKTGLAAATLPDSSQEPSPQIALFNDILPPPIAPNQAAEAALFRPTPAAAAPAREPAWKKEKARLQQQIDQLEALLSEQSDLSDHEPPRQPPSRELPGLGDFLQRHPWPIGAAAGVLIIVLIIQFAWIASLQSDLDSQRSQFEARLAQQQQALDRAQLDAREAHARADQLAEQLKTAQRQLGAAKAAAASARKASAQNSKSTQSAQSTKNTKSGNSSKSSPSSTKTTQATSKR